MLSNFRIAIVVFCFVLTFWLLQVSQSVKEIPIKRPLDQFPQKIGKWNLENKHALSNQVIKMIGVDDYISYDYASPDGSIVNLYVSYFKALGKTGGYHSPRDCLPASGWNIVSIKPLKLEVHHSENGPIHVNSMIIQKGTEKQVVLYWFQNRGRIIASEYWDKIYMVLDAILKGRRDGSFIRIMTRTQEGNISETPAYLEEFAEQVMIILEEYLPGS